MDRIAIASRPDHECCQRAVRLLLGSDGSQLDHQVRFQYQLLQHFRRLVMARHIPFEQLARRHQDLIRRLAPAALATHPVGQYAEQTAGCSGVLHDRDLILLVGTVATMQAGAGAKAVSGGRRDHGRKL